MDESRILHFVDGWSIELTEEEWADYISGNVDYWGIALN